MLTTSPLTINKINGQPKTKSKFYNKISNELRMKLYNCVI